MLGDEISRGSAQGGFRTFRRCWASKLSLQHPEKVRDSSSASWNVFAVGQPARRIGTAFFENVEQGLIGRDHDIRIEEVREKLYVAGRTGGYPSKALGEGMGPSHPLSWHCAFVSQVKPEFHPHGASKQAIIEFDERGDPVAIRVASPG